MGAGEEVGGVGGMDCCCFIDRRRARGRYWASVLLFVPRALPSSPRTAFSQRLLCGVWFFRPS